MAKVTLVKQPATVEDLELGRGTTVQVRGGVEKTLKRIGGSTLPYDEVGGQTIKEKIDALDAAGYTFSGLHDPSGGQEYPAAPSDGFAYTISLPAGTATYTFTAGDLVGWVTKAGDILVYNAGWTLIKVSVASDDHLRIDGSNTMAGALRMGDTHKITNLADGALDQDAATVKQVNLKIPTADIVNDLTTGGTELPLSAEQGKGLDAIKVSSDITGITGASAIPNMVSISQANYDNIATPDAATYYVIVG